jgi:aminoglycoside phosphotransferase (APT) family kinase protein
LTDALGRIRAIGDGRGGGSDGATVAGRELAALVERTARIVEPLGRANVPRVLEHGDPAHPNLLVRDDGSVAAVDWERGEADGLPLHDLTIALAYVAAAVRDAREATIQAAAFRDAMTGADPWAAAALDGEARRIGVDPALRPALVVAAFARSVAWLAEHLEVAARPSADTDAGPGATDGPADAVAWLAGDRSVALWRMALELAEAA